MKQIKLGYSIPDGKEVFVEPSHLIVTGITQQSGKTTTLEALINRNPSAKAIVFKTKPGEKSFSSGRTTPAFFRDRSDFEFVRSLIEAYSGDKMFIEKGTLMRLCKGTSNLIDIKKKVDDELASTKRGFQVEILTRLQHYLEHLIPQIQYTGLSKTMTLYEGVNIMDITNFSAEAQSLIISSVAEELLKNYTNTILVIAEAWKFLPQKGSNPCKGEVIKFIRQGATNSNFIWIDSQDMSGVDKEPLKQISTWILGYQAERNEVKHTLDQISLPAKSKPKVDDVMSLRIGEFYLSSREQVVKVYVQPTWVNDNEAMLVAKGTVEIKARKHDESSVNFEKIILTAPADKPSNPLNNGELTELRMDFNNKIQSVYKNMMEFAGQVNTYIANHQPPSIDSIVAAVLQKMPEPQQSLQVFKPTESLDKESIIAEVISRIPKMNGAVTYTVAPLEKIRKDFLLEIKTKITSDISSLSNDEKKALKYIEAKGQDVTPNEMVTQCFLLKPGGSASSKISNIFKALLSVEVVEKTAGGRYRAATKNRIAALMTNHEATSEEINNTYEHIISSLI